jgi:putative nucleotidyltransferase with HDIG domain
MIAIDNYQLLSSLEKSNSDLSAAYEATIEGWSRALDLRDHETEGHTERVAKMTIHLARRMGYHDQDLVRIRRGALLHDIGKMGIPDSILLKPGPLTDDEWVVMRRHPTSAYELLSPISFLRDSIDIPYCHHEKWDGTGYPRALKGTAIPQEARVFAVADIWDALQSDRPYRRAWPKEKIREHISGLSGTHLEPGVVKVFLEMDLDKYNITGSSEPDECGHKCNLS